MKKRSDIRKGAGCTKYKFGATPEGKVKQAIVTALQIAKDHGLPIWWTMPAANGSGETGLGDFLVCLNGDLIFIEAKAEHGRLSKAQERVKMEVEEANGTYLVVRGEEEAARLTTALMRMV